jgi:hypothetical protein
MNTLITDEQITEAREAAAHAAVHLEAVQASAPMPGESYAGWGHQLEAAHVKARATSTRVSALAAQQDAQREAVAARVAAEQTAGKTLDAMADQLAASRDATVKAIVAAEKAMAAMLAAVDSHDQLVKASAAQLNEAGLTVTDAAGEYDTGGTPRSGLVLRGEWWLPIDAGTALLRSVYGTARMVLGDRDPVAVRLKYTFGLQQLARQRGGLIEHVPPLKASAVPRPARVAVHAASVDCPPAQVDAERWRRGDR